MTAVALRTAVPTVESWAFDARDLEGLRSAAPVPRGAVRQEPLLSTRRPGPAPGCGSALLVGDRPRADRTAVPLVGAAGLGLLGAALADLFRQLTATASAFGTVFLIEAGLFLAAALMARRVMAPAPPLAHLQPGE